MKNTVQGFTKDEVIRELMAKIDRNKGKMLSQRQLKRDVFLPYDVVLRLIGPQRGYKQVVETLMAEKQRRAQESRENASTSVREEDRGTPMSSGEGKMPEKIVREEMEIGLQEEGKCPETQNKAEISEDRSGSGSDQGEKVDVAKMRAEGRRKPRLSIQEQERLLREFMISLGGRIPTVAELERQANEVWEFPIYRTLWKNFGSKKGWGKLLED